METNEMDHVYTARMEGHYDFRHITGHEANAANRQIAISADTPKHGNASHHYLVSDQSKIGTEEDATLSIIVFQTGPIREAGLNGVTNEVLLAIVADRLKGFQSSAFECYENGHALVKITEALHWLHARTRNRQERNVEGTSEL